MQFQQCETVIKQHYPGLRASEQKVADYVLLHPHEVLSLTMAELAKAAGVSDPTVLRFVRALGYGGFAAFKLALAQDAVSGQTPLGPLVDLHVQPGDELVSVPEKMIALAMRALEDTGRTLNKTNYEKAIQALCTARLIDVYGVGNSASVAADMVTKLLRIGLPCRFYPDNHLQQICAQGLTKGDVAVGISHSGSTRDTVDVLRMAHECGAATIAITNFKGADILRHADIALLTGDVETAFYTETMLSRISQLAIVDSLYMGVLLQDYERYSRVLGRVNEMVSHKVY
ncbi:MAG: RpiR family transcriptional regulator [Paenibacillaceae bacterium]|jgi:DNA-binding MurR/RpiR family transcriptional regulator|nr:RpiR family transcriptional regulator [Paenibacillaceae bacterium]